MFGKDENFINFISKPEGKRPCGRPTHRWEDNIGMNLREIGWEGVDWKHLAQDRGKWWALVNTVMNLLKKDSAPNFLNHMPKIKHPEFFDQ
jgi:hypothetical protein